MAVQCGVDYLYQISLSLGLRFEIHDGFGFLVPLHHKGLTGPTGTGPCTGACFGQGGDRLLPNRCQLLVYHIDCAVGSTVAVVVATESSDAGQSEIGITGTEFNGFRAIVAADKRAVYIDFPFDIPVGGVRILCLMGGSGQTGGSRCRGNRRGWRGRGRGDRSAARRRRLLPGRRLIHLDIIQITQPVAAQNGKNQHRDHYQIDRDGQNPQSLSLGTGRTVKTHDFQHHRQQRNHAKQYGEQRHSRTQGLPDRCVTGRSTQHRNLKKQIVHGNLSNQLVFCYYTTSCYFLQPPMKGNAPAFGKGK